MTVLWVCRRCSTKFAVGLSMCPQCTSTDCYEEGTEVPKISVHGGPTNEAADTEGGEQPSAGSSSSTSTTTPETPDSGETTSKPTSARTTASRSKRAREESGTAPTTDTGQTDGS